MIIPTIAKKALFKVGYNVLLVAILAIGSLYSYQRIKTLTAERDRYKRNSQALLTDMETFKVRDSLNAARVSSLELTLSEYKRYRADDAVLVADLAKKIKNLTAVNAAQSATIIALESQPRDTTIIVDSVMIPARKVHCGDAWYQFDGVITADTFTGTMVSVDSLVLTEEVRYKRFLGFLWKTGKVAETNLSCVSRNPHTHIQSLERIIIKK